MDYVFFSGFHYLNYHRLLLIVDGEAPVVLAEALPVLSDRAMRIES